MTNKLEVDKDISFEKTKAEVLKNPIARAACIENSIRTDLAAKIQSRLVASELGEKEFAKAIGVSEIQVKRLLGKEKGGALELNTIIRAVDFLGLELVMGIRLSPAKIRRVKGG